MSVKDPQWCAEHQKFDCQIPTPVPFVAPTSPHHNEEQLEQIVRTELWHAHGSGFGFEDFWNLPMTEWHREQAEKSLKAIRQASRTAVVEGRIDELRSMQTTWLKLGDPECGIAIDERITELRAQLSAEAAPQEKNNGI